MSNDEFEKKLIKNYHVGRQPQKYNKKINHKTI
jgi:hypothetical protein